MHIERLGPLVLFSGIAVCLGCQSFASTDEVVQNYDRLQRETQLRAARDQSGTSDVQAAAFEEAELPALREGPGDANILTGEGFSLAVRRATGRGPDRDEARTIFQEAETAFKEATELEGRARNKKYDFAASRFDEAGKKWPSSALEEDVLFKVAECRFFADDYPKAVAAYSGLIKKYPNSRHIDIVDARRFAIAQFWLANHKENPKTILEPNFFDRNLPRLDTFGNAVKLFDSIRLDDPTGNLADDATMAAATAYFKATRYQKADQMFEDLRTTFPSSEHQFEAHLLALKCKQMIYQGPDYDGTPLIEAEKLVKKIRRQFPNQYREHREAIDQSFAEVRAKLAEKDWRMARHYERRKEYGGARFYYAEVVRKFPSTTAANEAQERLAAISDRPDRTPSPVARLVSYFEPDDDEERDPFVTNESADR